MQTTPTTNFLSCNFCGSLPTLEDSNGKLACYRHENFIDLTGGDNSSIGNSSKRKAEVFNDDDHDDFAVPHLTTATNKGKKKARATGKSRECMICMSKFRVAGVTCGADKHHSCKGCTRDYITKTLGSKGTVYFDRVPCMELSCWSLIPAKEAKGALAKKVLADFERKEWDMSYLIGGDRDPSSQTLLDKDSRNCPNCNIPITKTQGCSHVVCVCQHEFWYDCKCTNYPFHEENCSQGYAPARVVGN